MKNLPLSYRWNNPADNLNAIMQALVCTEEIGWRPHAKKMLVFATNSGLHFSSDGQVFVVLLI